jgi:YD repeat-containing protein
MSDDLISKGVLVRWWSKLPIGQVANWQLKVNDMSGAQPAVLSTPMVSTTLVAKTGEWTLYEASVKLTGVTSDKKLSFSLLNNASSVAYVDDYRIQPADAQASCFVYDNSNLRLLATFDDRHFAMIYQYDAEGKLVRKIVETEKGMKTISETQYNIPNKSR